MGQRVPMKFSSIGTRSLQVLTGLALGLAMSTVRVARAADTSSWDKVFPQSDKVIQQKVSFTNRLGIRLVADLYAPKHLDRSLRHSALVVGHPFGGVKEQSSGLYAQTMAERGFVTLAHDASYNGESGGQPHNLASPEALIEDFSAAVDFLGTRPFVDRKRIGVIGVCGSGGFALAAAQIDPRIRAIATVSMYDMGRERRSGMGDNLTEADRRKALEEVADQRWIEAEGGARKPLIPDPKKLTEKQAAAGREFFDYYGTPRGQHPRSSPMTLTSNGALMQFYPVEHLDWISPRPILLIAGETAHSRYFSEDAYKLAVEPKELFIVPGAGHVDLYDRVNLIPWDKLTSFFTEHLK